MITSSPLLQKLSDSGSQKSSLLSRRKGADLKPLDQTDLIQSVFTVKKFAKNFNPENFTEAAANCNFSTSQAEENSAQQFKFSASH